MSTYSYLDSTGLAYLIEKIDSTFVAKSDTTPATTISIDSTPTYNSNNLVYSGGVYTGLSELKNKVVQPNWNESDSTSYAYILNKPTIPDDSNLVHKTGNETISGNKTFNGKVILNEAGSTVSHSIVGSSTVGFANDFSWIRYEYGNSSYTLQQALDYRNNVQADWSVSDSTSYAYIQNKPTIPALVKSDWNETNSASYAYILNKPSIPDDSYLVHKTGDETIGGNKTFSDEIHGSDIYGSIYSNYAELSGQTGILPNGTLVLFSDYSAGNDALLIVGNQNGNQEAEIGEQATGGWIQIINERTNKTLQDELDIRDNVQSDWNNIDTTSYAYILNKPTIPALVKSDWSVSDSTSYAYILNKPSIPSLVKSDWNESDSTSYAYIQNKPSVSTTVIENDTNAVSGGAVYAKIADLIGGAPEALNTLQEIAYALNNDPDLAATLTNLISYKTPKVENPTAGNFAYLLADGTIGDSGHKHSDYITEIKTINNNSIVGSGNLSIQENVQSDWDESDSTAQSYIQNKPNVSTIIFRTWS